MCIDLEDSVPADGKAAARVHAAAAFRELDFGRRVRMLRINGLDTPFAYRDVVDVVEAAGDRIDLVMLPKAGSAQDVGVSGYAADADRGASRVRAADRNRGADRDGGRVSVCARDCAGASSRLEALIFGPGRLLGIDADAVVVDR